jgi:F-type H+-transporting ATPase subunit epsilon
MIVEILTPEKSIFKGEASSVSLPGMDGSLGLLDRHAPLITSLKKGTLRLKVQGGKVEEFEVNGGTVEVMNNKVIILAE